MYLEKEIPDFSHRSKREEWMEDPHLPFETLAETVDAVERISWVTGGRRVSISGIEQLASNATDTLSVLDVGSGNGGLARLIAEWGIEAGLDIEVLGIDILPKAVEAARRRHDDLDRIRFECIDLFDISERSFDVVHASLVLHHFPGEDASRAVAKMGKLARLGVVVNDLHRHPVHWMAAKLLLPLVTRNRIALHDGPVSVLRGFTRSELIDLGRTPELASARVEWRFPFRWLFLARPT